MKLKIILLGAAIAAVGSIANTLGAPAIQQETVFHDDFSAMKVGMVSAGVIGAEVEYHYFPQTAPQGNWEVSCFRSEASQRAWRVLREEGFGPKFMYQASASSRVDSATTHPMLIAGDVLWGDYTLSVTFAPESKENWSGAIFRYRNDRCLYFFGVKQDTATLFLLNHGTAFRKSTLKVLAEKPYPYQPGVRLTAVVEVKGDHIRGELPNGLVLEANDSTFTHGRIGLLADVPTRFTRVKVTMSPESKALAEKEIAQRQQEEARLQAANPRMVLWKKFSTTGFGTGRSVRFGDLDGDGKLDVLFVQVNNHGPKDRNSEVGCLTAMTFDGKKLWQSGEPDPWRDRLTCDVACQIHDVDHDGKCEVIYCRDFELVIADGATGKVKRKIKTPLSPPRPASGGEPINRYERILGDSLYFLDLRGTGWPSDIILKDRYSRIYAYNDKLEPLWDVACNTGHYGYAYDMDGDGKDEFAIGYSLISHNGKVLWSLDKQLQDHADAVAILKLNLTDKEPMLFCAASDEGTFWTDLRGHILKHLYLGHVQSPSIANYRDDLPGLEAVTVNFHGNQGIIHFYDSKMDVYHDFEPMQHGSMMLPLNWTGRSEEYFVISPNVDEGVYDGWGRQVLKFPADGHPEMCYDVLDLTGDCRDEIVVWDPEEMWVYTQADNPKPGRLYKPKRNPLYNRSNYQATVSLPGWSE
jgi:rhamnogalacturonan endolyase